MDFQDDPQSSDDVFVLRFETWEGPIEALLDLAKTQKVDLSKIDILDLVAQFDAVIGRALSLRIELAADWLVMAAWLAYLKSRLLLRRPRDRERAIEDDDVLAFHLKRLNAVRTVAEKLPSGLVLGRDWFGPSGAAEQAVRGNTLTSDFHAFLASYPVVRTAEAVGLETPPDLKPFDLASVDAALSYLAERMPPEWIELLKLVPYAEGIRLRSNIASNLIASLEMARDGHAEIEQHSGLDPVMVRRRERA
ncbi:segregation/condensation protein A [Pararhizobium sp. BT-229]|uniref:segregation and condensation protein A n=1 Tax=Pararhizobium sp. BT-229 TaxID=2986923 RepID=UPI0021F7C9BA|nr:segregation/condensation protein A [Pararhizobium sp. BT-229]MCV9963806.1 segregation/condensation protein A [Pararhizobium sp. BT-229]